MAVADIFRAAADIFRAAVDSGIWEQLARVGEASAVIASAVALIGLWLTLRDNRKRSREKEVVEWQKVVVFTIIAFRGPIQDVDILKHYLDSEQVVSEKSLLRNKLLGVLGLQSILLSLIADNAIMILPEEDSPPLTFLYSIVRAIPQARTNRDSQKRTNHDLS